MIITLGLLSGLLTTCAWLPQLLRTWRRGRADDISYTYLAVFAAGVLGWLAYGLVAEQPAVFAANVVTFTLIVALALLKTHPRRPRTARTAERGAQRSHRPPPGVPKGHRRFQISGKAPAAAHYRARHPHAWVGCVPAQRIRARCLLLAAFFSCRGR